MKLNIRIGSYKNLLAEEFAMALSEDKEALLIDVRTPQEFYLSHIPGAVNMDVMSNCFDDAVKSLDRSKSCFIYCMSGGRSGHACSLLAEQGFRVYNLMGGIANWTGERT